MLDSRGDHGLPPWATSRSMRVNGRCIGHWWLQANTIPPGKNHGATRCNWSSGLQTWALRTARVPIHFPGIWGLAWATPMGEGACRCCIGHWWLQCCSQIPNTLSPQGKNHGATRWNWSSGLQTWTWTLLTARVPSHFPGLCDSQRYVSNLQRYVSVGVPIQSGFPFFAT